MLFFKPDEKTDEELAKDLLAETRPLFDKTSRLSQHEQQEKTAEKVQALFENHPDMDKQRFMFALGDVFVRQVVDKLDSPCFEALNSAFNRLQNTLRPC